MAHFFKFHDVLNGVLEMFFINFVELLMSAGAWGTVVVKALRY